MHNLGMVVADDGVISFVNFMCWCDSSVSRVV